MDKGSGFAWLGLTCGPHLPLPQVSLCHALNPELGPRGLGPRAVRCRLVTRGGEGSPLLRCSLAGFR